MCQIRIDFTWLEGLDRMECQDPTSFLELDLCLLKPYSSSIRIAVNAGNVVLLICLYTVTDIREDIFQFTGDVL